MNLMFAKMITNLEEFKGVKEQHDSLLDRREQETYFTNRFVKNEVIGIADAIDRMQDDM